MAVITYRCGDTLYATVPRKRLAVEAAIEKLVKAITKTGATPHKELLDAGFLGETDGPTLYAMKGDLVARCRCGSTVNVNDNGCCGSCQLKEAKAA